MALSIPVLALAIPIVAILTQHQRKMAEIYHQTNLPAGLIEEIGNLRHEVYQLKQRLNDQAIQLDELKSLPKPPNPGG